MAFTQQNEKDGYLFFVVAFDAVPGKTYAAQVVEAYEAGMTTQQIVNEFTTKPAFTDIYGADLSNADFAQSFVANVTANLTTAINADVQAQAIADIEAALDAGLTIGDVIFNVITNISNKSVADAEWGPLVQLIQNKVAVAEALTEGEFALDTTDAGALKAPMAAVTEKYESVAEAITKGGDLKALLANKLAADKAEAEYAKSLGLTLTAEEADDEGAEEGDKVTDPEAVATLIKDRLDKIVASLDSDEVTTYEEFAELSTAKQNVLIANAKAEAADAVTVAEEALADAKAAVNKVPTLAAKGKALTAAKDALTAAEKATGLAKVEVEKQVGVYNVGKEGDAKVSWAEDGSSFSIAGVSVIEVDEATKKFVFADGVTSAQKTALTALLKSANDLVAAEKAHDAATEKAQAAEKAVDDLSFDANGDGTVGENEGVGQANDLLDEVVSAEQELKKAQKSVTDLNADLAEMTTYVAQLAQLGKLADAVEAADKLLKEADYAVQDLVSAAVATEGKDIFLVDADSESVAALTLTAGDSIFVGSSYTLNASGDLAKGNDSALEIFFKANAAGDTDVYIEQKAFGSNVADAASGVNGNIIKVTLTGVAAEDVSLVDGFITVAA